jgi:excinuclease ABC subunit C
METPTPLIEERLRRLPKEPGVYLFKDAAGRLLYVGKANSLYNRVRSYFQSRAGQSLKIQLMVPQIADIDYLITESPVQALKWEADLIKQHQPRYNVRLRDDKHYPYIKITVQEPWPRMEVARRVADDGARYFGPFTDATSVRQTMEALSRLFPRIRCDWPHQPKDRACLYYHIRRCPAPCVGFIRNEDYRDLVEQSIRFLEGKGPHVLRAIRQQMEEAAERLEFERAALLRDRVRALETVVFEQQQISQRRVDQDVLGLARAERGPACVQLLFIRQGRLLGKEHFVLDGADEESDEAVIASFLVQFYSAAAQVPREIVVPYRIEEAAAVEDWLRERGGHPVRLVAPQRGEKRRLVQIATDNAREALERLQVEWMVDAERTTGALIELQERLGLSQPPERIECYDISNIQGNHAVGSMVVFEGGRPSPGAYRRFRIKAVGGPNDFAMLQEVLRRRFHRGSIQDGSGDDAWANLPDLVVIDGGKGQLSAALEIARELSLTEIPMIALAKEREEVFRPGQREPLVLPRSSPALFLLQRLRDEAHRFAVTYHRQVRQKAAVRSPLDDVPGIGPKRKRLLLRRFGSLKALREATVDEIAAVPGFTRRLAELLKERL